MALTILLILLSLPASCPEDRALVIFEAPVINPYEAIWNAICQVESAGNQFAIGDKHLKQFSYGIVQIRQTRLDDYYQETGIRYYETDMFDVEKSKTVFMVYALKIGYMDVERISREWNGGDSGMKKKATVKYWNRVKDQLTKIKL
jgi:hypothetical protein